MHKHMLWIWIALVAVSVIGCSGSGGIQPASLVRIVEEIEGARCEFGGQRIMSGTDFDGDGFLSESETTSTAYVCEPPTVVVKEIKVSDEAPGGECANGGKRIDVWIDADSDGLISEDETAETSYVCNGESNTSVIASLIDLVDEVAGENCESGGKRLDAGVDSNGDGILDPDEVTSSKYICNLESVAALIKVSDEPAGDLCANGGKLFELGLDSNKNGILDAEEVEVSEALCRDAAQVVRLTELEEDPYECLRGGIRVDAGVDQDGDAILGDAEIEDSTLVCNTYPLYPLEVTAGGRHSCALLSNRTVQCWGDNTQGQLGDGGGAIANDDGMGFFDSLTPASSGTPVKVPTLSDVVQITAGFEHTCVLTRRGEAYCWGNNVFGQLGNGASNSAPEEHYKEVPDPGDGSSLEIAFPELASRPVKVNLSNITHISAGMFHTCAVSDGQAFCWGGNFWGQLGNDSEGEMVPGATPTAIAGLSGIVSVATGSMHSCALEDDGEVQCWGDNSEGQLGNGSNNDQLTPSQVITLVGAKEITAGHQHTCALLDGGQVFCWGDNAKGQLGDGSSNDRSVPVDVNGLIGVLHLGSGNSHTCAVLENGRAVCWGDNTTGQLGNGTNNPTNNAEEVSTLGIIPTLDGTSSTDPLEVVLSADAGGNILLDFAASGAAFDSVTLLSSGQSCFGVSDGEVYCWGENGDGQLGTGTGNLSLPGPVLIQFSP